MSANIELCHNFKQLLMNPEPDPSINSKYHEMCSSKQQLGHLLVVFKSELLKSAKKGSLPNALGVSEICQLKHFSSTRHYSVLLHT